MLSGGDHEAEVHASVVRTASACGVGGSLPRNATSLRLSSRIGVLRK